VAYNDLSGTLFKIGGDFSGYFVRAEPKSPQENHVKTNTGFNISVEKLYYFNNLISLGAGISGRFPIKLKTGQSKLNSIPLYLSCYFTNYVDSNIDFFMVSRLGYGYLMGNDSIKDGYNLNGGLYYSIGVGLMYAQSLLLEVSYNGHRGNMKNNNDKIDIKYQHLMFQTGVLF
jgi:hypothetical protein